MSSGLPPQVVSLHDDHVQNDDDAYAAEERPRRSACGTCCLGCSVLIVVIAVAVALTAWFAGDRLVDVWHRTVSLFSEMTSIRQAVTDEFLAEGATVSVHWFSDGAGELRVTLINPSFLEDPNVDVAAKAREVARFVRQSLDDPERYGKIIITLNHRENKTGNREATSHTYEFDVGKLQQAEAPEDGAADGARPKSARPDGAKDAP